MNAQMLLQSFAGGEEERTYIEEVFSTYLRTSTGADVTVTNDIDMTKGYMLWSKGRSGATDHAIYDSARGVTFDLASNSTAGQTTQTTGLKSVSSTGYTVGSLSKMNTNGQTYVDWCFREAPKFFKKAVVTKSAGSNATVDLSSLGTVGMVTVKRTDAAGDWYTWHRSLDSGKLMYLNQTAAAATLGHITVSGTTLTLVNGVIVDGTYVVYAWAHDPSPNGMIQCGSFTTGASGNATVALGWEPQFTCSKTYAGSTTNGDWLLVDSMRGMPVISSGTDPSGVCLRANSTSQEVACNNTRPNSTGFSVSGYFTSSTCLYLAIRRGPMRVPTDGSKVFKPLTRTGTGAAATVTGVGFAPDAFLANERDVIGGAYFYDRLRGAAGCYLIPNATSAEGIGAGMTSFDMNGVTLDHLGATNGSSHTYINLFFRRAPGFFDIVCDTGTGAAHAINHSLTVAPELIIRKSRSANTQWEWWHSALTATEKLVLNSTAGKATDATAFGTLPTATQFYVGASSNTNASAATYVTYLFATCPGVSKVGYYTGNSTSLTVECGFSTGARFILAKSIDDAGDSFIWDSARGIVASNDPHFSLNTAAAEVTTDDSVDPYAGGFIVNQNTATNINVNGKRYVYLAIA